MNLITILEKYYFIDKNIKINMYSIGKLDINNFK